MPKPLIEGNGKVAWVIAALWAAVIFATVPFAGDGVSYVRQYGDDDIFAYVVGACVIGLFGVAVHLLRKRQRKSISSYLWLLAIAVIVIYQVYELEKGTPVEAIHFLQYGLLSLLLFRAFAYKVADYSIYAAVTIIGSTIGMLDETIQWLTPGRHFGLEDIWLNFTAVALVQAALALGIKPRRIAGWPDRLGLRRLCRLGAIAVAYLGLCFLNTPDLIADDHGVMIEYGDLHGDDIKGRFRSLLAITELRRQDAGRAIEGGLILQQYRDRDKYGEFLAIYTPLKDPFLHEAQVHIYSRDINLERARNATDKTLQKWQFTSAHWENLILEDYFGQLLSAADNRWPDDLKTEIAGKIDNQRIFKSFVSRHLITAFTQAQVLWGFLFVVLGLLMLARHLGRNENTEGGVRADA